MIANRSDFANYLICFVLGGVVLYIGKPLFIPLSFALLISFIVYPVVKWMQQKGVPGMLAIIAAVSVVMLLLLALVALLLQQIVSFASEWDTLSTQLLESILAGSRYINEHFHITQEQQEEWFSTALKNSTAGILSLIKNLLFTSGISFVLMVIIPVYAVLILHYRGVFVEVLFSFFPSDKRVVLQEILFETIHQYHNFIRGMLIVYLIVGTLNSIGLLVLGIERAIFFGFIASILTFIPYVGIMVAALLPIAVSWITYDSAWYPIGVIAVFSVVQYLEANVIYPYVVGSRLHLNTLVILVAVIAGGILWGGSGMILFIPFVAIIKLIADRTNGWEPVARLLGEQGGRLTTK